jgi:hypothetical protein
MPKQSTNTPSRNAPCVCGSGKKSKRCCGTAPPAQEVSATQETSSRQPWLLALGLFGVIAIAVYTISLNRLSSVAGTAPPAGISDPKPWQYDAVSNQHWDARSQHWHQGRPPYPLHRPYLLLRLHHLPSGTAPKPWQYDIVNNRHWDAFASALAWRGRRRLPAINRFGSSVLPHPVKHPLDPTALLRQSHLRGSEARLA